MADAVAWLNGNEIPMNDMRLPVWDLGVVAGAAISEMARTYQHEPFRFAEHISRLTESCHELGFPTAWTAQQLEKAAIALVQKNSQHLDEGDDLGVVWFFTAGSNQTYLGNQALPPPTAGIHTFRLPFALWRNAAEFGVRLRIPERTAMSVTTLPAERKIRNRLHWWLADREADAVESGARALLQTSDGWLTETSTSAFYAVMDGVIVTPRTNVLRSMSLRLVREAAEACGFGFERTDLTRGDIGRMEQAFLSSTPSGLLPVHSIDGHELPDAHILEPLLNWWQVKTGLNPRTQILSHSADSSGS